MPHSPSIVITVSTPLGQLAIRGNENHIHRLTYDEKAINVKEAQATWGATAKQQLKDYFNGTLTEFILPLAPFGTEFQKRVWNTLLDVPYGCTTTYQQLANTLNKPTAVRAVANANARNPIWIVIPCHRIIGTDTSLRGYAGGLDRKAALLKHEGLAIQEGTITKRTRVLNHS